MQSAKACTVLRALYPIRNNPSRIIHSTSTQGFAAAGDTAEGRSGQTGADGLPVSAKIVCSRFVCYTKARRRLPRLRSLFGVSPHLQHLQFLMAPTNSSNPVGQKPLFATTRWSVVLAARCDNDGAREPLNALCSSYWYPLYAFVRRQGVSAEDAQDLTQEFFARLLSNAWLEDVELGRGRFRSWLVACMKHFLANEWDKARAQKRGGDLVFIELDAQTAESRYAIEPADGFSAEKLYDRRWALTLLERTLDRLEEEMTQSGRLKQFESLKFCLIGERGPSYATVATQLGLSEGAVKVTVHRMRERYRALIREEVAQTVESETEIESEMRLLLAALG